MSQQPPAHRIDAKVREYLRHCEQKRLARKSIEFYTLKLQNFTRWCEQHSIATLADITSEQAREFFYNYGNTHNPGGTHAVFRTVRAWVNWCRNTHALDGWQPLKGAAIANPPDDPLPPAEEEVMRALLGTCHTNSVLDRRDRAIIRFLYDTGLRANEMLMMDVSDVDLTTGEVTVKHGKGGRRRIAFCGEATLRAVSNYLRNRRHGPLFASKYGTRLAYRTVHCMLVRRSVRAGVPRATPHAFRRAYCRTMVRAGTDIFTLKRLMGHKDIQTTQRYVMIDALDMHVAHERASPGDRL